jgi:hypothetical protein
VSPWMQSVSTAIGIIDPSLVDTDCFNASATACSAARLGSLITAPGSRRDCSEPSGIRLDAKPRAMRTNSFVDLSQIARHPESDSCRIGQRREQSRAISRFCGNVTAHRELDMRAGRQRRGERNMRRADRGHPTTCSPCTSARSEPTRS